MMATFDDPVVEKIYQDGVRHIETIRSLNSWDANGVLELPFVCYGCAKKRMDYALTTGDGLPMCEQCLGFAVDALSLEPA